MFDSTRDFKPPSIVLKSDGSPRRIGFEMEFSGLSLEQTADTLQTALGGRLKAKNTVEWTLESPELGDFKIELDWHYLKREAEVCSQQAPKEGLSDLINQKWVDWLAQASTVVVPLEIACPPLPVDRLDALLPMVEALRNAGAVGTEASPVAAYGVHVNAEIPHLDAGTLFRYLKAFALLQWWLVDAQSVNATRRLSPYIDFYPEPYLLRLASQPEPSLAQIVADYLAYNPTRNRALDLLPMLALADPDAVRFAIDDPRIIPRPAFHYRLPDCRIDRADWSLADAWNSWWIVEQLAARPKDLDRLSLDFQVAERPLLGVSRSAWVAHVDRWLKGCAWA